MSRQSGKSNEPSPKRRNRSNTPVGWVRIAVAPDRIAGGMLESAVRAEGIPVILQNSLFPYMGVGGQYGVLVPVEHADEARAILREIWDIGNCDSGSSEDKNDS